MELVFVHETGYPDVDGASETSEESVEDDDGEGWGCVELSSPNAGKCGTPQSRALPIGGDQSTLEKVRFHLFIVVSSLIAVLSVFGPIAYP